VCIRGKNFRHQMLMMWDIFCAIDNKKLFRANFDDKSHKCDRGNEFNSNEIAGEGSRAFVIVSVAT
jgi:hypothetical protein